MVRVFAVRDACLEVAGVDLYRVFDAVLLNQEHTDCREAVCSHFEIARRWRRVDKERLLAFNFVSAYSDYNVFST